MITKVVVRKCDVLNSWHICHARSYQAAVRGGFETRSEAIDHAKKYGFDIVFHEFDQLQQDKNMREQLEKLTGLRFKIDPSNWALVAKNKHLKIMVFQTLDAGFSCHFFIDERPVIALPAESIEDLAQKINKKRLEIMREDLLGEIQDGIEQCSNLAWEIMRDLITLSENGEQNQAKLGQIYQFHDVLKNAKQQLCENKPN